MGLAEQVTKLHQLCTDGVLSTAEFAAAKAKLLGKPPPLAYKAVIFDLDGVITKTAAVHSMAWKAMFDAFLEKRDGPGFSPFTPDDYLKYVDGKPRYDGVRSFLASRGIKLPDGDPKEKGNAVGDNLTVCSLGNAKNDFFLKVLDEQGVQEYPTTVALIRELKARGVHVACASSSKNCKRVLEAAHLIQYMEARVDGVVSAEIGLKGKPAGDIFVTASQRVGVHPSEAIVVEDAESGVKAGRNGNFRLVVGLARENNEKELRHNGAHVVLPDFGTNGADALNEWFLQQPIPGLSKL
eukprot:TRINITY_DN16135_c0_g1_i1.p1 TRINITY_DN16135_c0_g1~~TRINITY_DN16135_c0_g1_i1.p1  ORF type:complete len:296 (+),score=135.19 TRINITY_DN16135_c0_g1_i1:84-971(+)